MVLAQFTSGIAAQASASRLLYAMGRDSVLPRRLFGKLHPNFHTPVFNIVLTGAIVLGLLTTRAVRDFVHTDPVVQHDLAMLFGTGVDVDPSRLNAERDATRAPSADPMEWPAVEYRD